MITWSGNNRTTKPRTTWNHLDILTVLTQQSHISCLSFCSRCRNCDSRNLNKLWDVLSLLSTKIKRKKKGESQINKLICMKRIKKKDKKEKKKKKEMHNACQQQNNWALPIHNHSHSSGKPLLWMGNYQSPTGKQLLIWNIIVSNVECWQIHQVVDHQSDISISDVQEVYKLMDVEFHHILRSVNKVADWLTN